VLTALSRTCIIVAAIAASSVSRSYADSDTDQIKSLLDTKPPQYDQAVAAATAVIQQQPTNVQAYVYRALAYRREKKWQLAINDETALIKLQPNNPALNLATLYVTRGWLYGYLTHDLKKKANLDTDRTQLGKDLGQILSEWNADVSDQTNALSLDPKNVDAFEDRGWARKNLYDVEAALADLNGAHADTTVVLDDLNGKHHDAKVALGDANGALADETQALTANHASGSDKLRGYQMRAAVYIQLEEWQQAIADETELIQLRPSVSFYVTRGWAYGQIADAFAKTGRYDAKDWKLDVADQKTAILINRNVGTNYDPARAYDPKEPAYADAFPAQENLNDWRGAISDQTALISLDQCQYAPNHHVDRGWAHAILSEYAAAIDDATTAVKLDRNSTAAYYARAVAYAQINDAKHASSDADAIERLYAANHPNAPDASKLQEWIRIALADWKGAAGYGDKAVKSDSSDPYAYIGLAIARTELGDPNRAIVAANSALARAPKDENALLASALAYFARGDAARGDFTRASREATAALRADGDNADARVTVAVLDGKLGSPKAERANALAALSLHPSNAAAIAALGNAAYLNAGNSANAQTQNSLYRDSVALESISLAQSPTGNPFALMTRGAARYYLNNAVGAVEDETQALKSDPNSAFALQFRGAAYVDMANPSYTVRDETSALKVKRRDAFAYLMRGEAYLMLKDNRSAEADEEAANGIRPSALAWEVLGDARADSGDLSGAESAYRAALGLGATDAGTISNKIRDLQKQASILCHRCDLDAVLVATGDVLVRDYADDLVANASPLEALAIDGFVAFSHFSRKGQHPKPPPDTGGDADGTDGTCSYDWAGNCTIVYHKVPQSGGKRHHRKA
jgi:predicted Zn-dependent protease